jgi:AcrR family transcriptional regulator
MSRSASEEPAGRVRLSRDAVVEAAVALIEREGEQAVSMRRVAAELDTSAMALYTYVANKAALLDAVADYVMAQVAFARDPTADWQHQARALVHALRHVARSYPRSLMAVVSRRLTSTAGLRPLELALETARAAGFDGHQAVQIVRTFISYAFGSLVHEFGLTRMRSAADPVAASDLVTSLDPVEYPNVRRLAGPLLDLDPDADFDFGLDLLIGAVAALSREPTMAGTTPA